jgi:hypothetical protein
MIFPTHVMNSLPFFKRPLVHSDFDMCCTYRVKSVQMSITAGSIEMGLLHTFLIIFSVSMNYCTVSCILKDTV